MTKEQIESDIAMIRDLAQKYIRDEQYSIAQSMLNLIEQLQWAMPCECEMP
jgi:hypothetical protein